MGNEMRHVLVSGPGQRRKLPLRRFAWTAPFPPWLVLVHCQCCRGRRTSFRKAMIMAHMHHTLLLLLLRSSVMIQAKSSVHLIIFILSSLSLLRFRTLPRSIIYLFQTLSEIPQDVQIRSFMLMFRVKRHLCYFSVWEQ